jgi:hypothetical protein
VRVARRSSPTTRTWADWPRSLIDMDGASLRA